LLFFSKWESIQSDSWTEEMIEAFGQALLLEDVLTDDNEPLARKECREGEPPTKKARKNQK
jgi:hypothetical protein